MAHMPGRPSCVDCGAERNVVADQASSQTLAIDLSISFPLPFHAGLKIPLLVRFFFLPAFPFYLPKCLLSLLVVLLLALSVLHLLAGPASGARMPFAGLVTSRAEREPPFPLPWWLRRWHVVGERANWGGGCVEQQLGVVLRLLRRRHPGCGDGHRVAGDRQIPPRGQPIDQDIGRLPICRLGRQPLRPRLVILVVTRARHVGRPAALLPPAPQDTLSVVA